MPRAPHPLTSNACGAGSITSREENKAPTAQHRDTARAELPICAKPFLLYQLKSAYQRCQSCYPETGPRSPNVLLGVLPTERDIHSMGQRMGSCNCPGWCPCTLPSARGGTPSRRVLPYTAVPPRCHQTPGASIDSREGGCHVAPSSQGWHRLAGGHSSCCWLQPHHPHPSAEPELKGPIVGPRVGWGGAVVDTPGCALWDGHPAKAQLTAPDHICTEPQGLGTCDPCRLEGRDSQSRDLTLHLTASCLLI